VDFFSGIINGFAISFSLINLLYCFIGVFIGTLIGVLPGIGPVGTISLLLPATFHLNPVSAIIMLAGIYYGAMYGGSTTSILVNIPGEAASVITCLDGYQMARQGRAGAALGISAFGSFIAGTIGVIGLMFLAYPLARMALKFGPPEYFSLMCLGLTILTYLARGSMLRAMSMALLGLLLSFIGIDAITGLPRFTLDMVHLMDGIGLVPIAMGIFGISEVLINLEEVVRRDMFKTKIEGLLPNREEWRRSSKPILRGTIIGFFLGILPGGGALVSSFVSYGVEKKLSMHPEKFGTGMIEGVAGPESANNAAVGGAFIPLFTLGIPANVTMAVLFGALMIHGMTPGPMLMREHPEVFWGTVTSMYMGNVLLLLLNLPLIGLWVKVLKIPYRILFPLIILFCLIGAYSLNNTSFDIVVMLIFGLAGYLMRKLNYEGAPLLLAFVLGPMMEQALRQSLLISQGSFTIFFTRPISAASTGLALALIVSYFLPFLKKKRLRIEEEAG
jgi:putative tricarboxylic transport membrane protein